MTSEWEKQGQNIRYQTMTKNQKTHMKVVGGSGAVFSSWRWNIAGCTAAKKAGPVTSTYTKLAAMLFGFCRNRSKSFAWRRFLALVMDPIARVQSKTHIVFQVSSSLQTLRMMCRLTTLAIKIPHPWHPKCEVTGVVCRLFFFCL